MSIQDEYVHSLVGRNPAGCGHPDQALDIAGYMVREIQDNSTSLIAIYMKLQNDCAPGIRGIGNYKNSVVRCREMWGGWKRNYHDFFYEANSFPRMKATISWAAMVAPNGTWDHKKKISKKFPTDGTRRWHHKYRDYKYYYDTWSNIHYWYLGSYCGFSDNTLLSGAGAAQAIHNWVSGRPVLDNSLMNGPGLRSYDDVTDSISVRLGIDLYWMYPNPDDISAQTLMDIVSEAPYPVREGAKIQHNCAL